MRAVARRLCLLAALAIVGCGAAPEAGPPPPKAAGVVRTFTTLDEDGEARLTPGQRFAVRLASWAEWRPDAIPPGLRHVETLIGSTTEEDLPGADQWQVLVFEAVSPGEGELRLGLFRPGSPEAPLNTFRLRIVVRPASGA